jgi:hypothetical protein
MFSRIRLGYLLFAAGVLTPILGNMLYRDLNRDSHFYFSSLAAVLCLLGLLAVSTGRRERGRYSRSKGNNDAHSTARTRSKVP